MSECAGPVAMAVDGTISTVDCIDLSVEYATSPGAWTNGHYDLVISKSDDSLGPFPFNISTTSKVIKDQFLYVIN